MIWLLSVSCIGNIKPILFHKILHQILCLISNNMFHVVPACSRLFQPVLVAGVYLNGAFLFGIMRMLMMIALLPLGSSYHYGVCQNKPPYYGALVSMAMLPALYLCKPTYPTYATCGGIFLRSHDGSMTLFTAGLCCFPRGSPWPPRLSCCCLSSA